MSEDFDAGLLDEGETPPQGDKIVREYVTEDERLFVYTALHVYSFSGVSLVEACRRAASAFEGIGVESLDRKDKRKISAIRQLGMTIENMEGDMPIHDVFEKAGFALDGNERPFMGMTFLELSTPATAAALFGILSNRLAKS